MNVKDTPQHIIDALPKRVSTRRDIRIIAALVVFLGLYLTLLLLFPNKHFTVDALRYVNQLSGRWDLTFHPHHLLFVSFWKVVTFPLSGWVDRFAQAMVYSAVLSVFFLFCAYRLFHSLSESKAFALSCMAVLAFSYSYWQYSIEFESYLMLHGMTIVSIYTFQHYVHGRKTVWFIATAAIVSFAVLYHQMAIFLALGLGAVLLVDGITRRRFEHVAIFSVIVIVLVSGTYSAIWAYLHAHVAEEAPYGLMRWLTTYVQIQCHTPFNASSVPLSAIAVVKCFVYVGDRLFRFLPWSAAGGVVMIALAVPPAVFFAKQRCMPRSRERWMLLSVALLLLLQQLLLEVLTSPGNIRYIINTPLALLLCLCLLVRIRPPRRFSVSLAVFAAVMALWNLLFAIVPFSNLATNENYRVAAFEVEEVGPDDLFVGLVGSQDDYLKRFFGIRRNHVYGFFEMNYMKNPVRAQGFSDMLRVQIDSTLRAGQRVFTTDLGGSAVYLIETYPLFTRDEIEAFYRRYEKVEHLSYPTRFGEGKVMELKLPAAVDSSSAND